MTKLHTIGNIEIRIHPDDTKKHKHPHFHASSPTGSAVIVISTLEVLVTDMPNKKLDKITSWAAQNIQTLTDHWNELNPQQPIK